MAKKWGEMADERLQVRRLFRGSRGIGTGKGESGGRKRTSFLNKSGKQRSGKRGQGGVWGGVAGKRSESKRDEFTER